MQTDSTSDFPALPPKSGVLVVDGYGIRVRVDRRHLVVSDGIGRSRRERRFHRATSGLSRLVVLGHAGYVTLEALRWLSDADIGFYQIDSDGRVIAASSVLGSDKPALRRAQALAAGAKVGIEITRELLVRKVAGQQAVLSRLSERSLPLSPLERARTLDQLRIAGAGAAADYWSGWADVRVRLGKADRARLPDHWLRFGSRSSTIANGPRKAINPANAILNYCYALLEAECRIACLAVGLDPGIGILHADFPSRDSMALDIMEAVRPDIDGFVLNLLTSRTFRAADFVETREGGCRLLAPLTHHLAVAAPTWGRSAGAAAEVTAKMLAAGTPRVGRIATRITETNRSTGRGGTRKRPRRGRARANPPPKACRACGLILERAGRTFCDGCIDNRRKEQLGALMVSSLLG